MKIRIVLSLCCLSLAACSGGSSSAPPSKVLGRFQKAANCDEVKSYVQDYVDRAQEFADRTVPVAPPVLEGPTPGTEPSPDSGEDGVASPSGGTVIQSDLAFTDVDRGLFFVFSANNLKILKASPAAEAQVLSEVELGFPPQELVSLKVGARRYAVIFGGQGYFGIGPMPAAAESTIAPLNEESILAVYDVSNPASPTKLLQETAPGRFLEARALVEGGKVAWVSERWLYLGEGVEDADLFPQKTSLRDGGTNQLPLSACQNTLLYQNESLNPDYAPYSLTATTISLLDLNQALLPVVSQAVLSPAWRTLIAANGDHLMLAQNVDGAERSDTEVYRFDLGGETPLAFLDAAQVPGNILNQFFIDEREGVLRVFHHVAPSFGSCPECPVAAEPAAALKAQATDPNLATGNYLSTYRGGSLLGRSGPFEEDEVPYAARFLGRFACVVTFIQIDPLTCFDLQDPAKPAKLGELEIEGVSFHLEDLGQGFLLGIGRGGAGGVVANLFDVSEPSQPQLAKQLALNPGGGTSFSEVFYDPRALGKDQELRNFSVPTDDAAGSKLALFSVDLATRNLQPEGELLKPFSDTSYDAFRRAYFFADSLATLSFQKAEIFSRSPLSPVFSLPLEN
ncbi:MAG TPA: beta-propeller domain-containing protein [bacterium]|nr:beta-propeller domain-containing protein [bacterium]